MTMRRPLAAAALLLLLALAGAPSALTPPAALAATDPDEVLADPALEERARGLTRQLRCLVCQNQSIDDSNADLARDLRRLVRERLEAGDTDEEVIAFMTARYGDFVLLKPPVRPGTYALWFGPVLVLLVAGGGVAVYLRRRRRGLAAAAGPEPLSPAERARLDALLGRVDDAGGDAADHHRRRPA
jgi:cytochrome c-type biogenesis protein CcmH